MSTYFKIVWLISSITILISSTDISAQESDREQVPGGRPDDSWRDAPKMFYDPHPDKHFRR